MDRCLKPALHDGTRHCFVANPLIECADGGIRVADQQHRLAHATLSKPVLANFNDLAAKSLSLGGGIYGDIPKPATMTVVERSRSLTPFWRGATY